MRPLPSQQGRFQLGTIAEVGVEATLGDAEPPSRRAAEPPSRRASGSTATAARPPSAMASSAPLELGGVLQRYDVVDDRWRRVGPLPAGSDRYSVESASAPVSQALRILRQDHVVSNSVFVSDPERLRRAHQKAIGKARATPEELARLGLGDQLLADLEELRRHLLAVGAVSNPDTGQRAENGVGGEGADAPPIRPAPDLSLEDYLAACDPVLGHRMTEFSLLLPALAGVGAALDDAAGTLDNDRDVDDSEPDETEEAPTLGEELRRQGTTERARFRRFVERLVARAADYPVIVRNLAVRCVLHGLAADLWPDDRWPDVLVEALKALAASGDEPNEHERDAAASLAAVGLAVLRTDVASLSRRDERTLRYESSGVAVAQLLPHAADDKIELLDAEILRADPSRQLADAATAVAAARSIDDALRRPRGPERAARLLTEEHDRRARVSNDRVIELLDPLPEVAEPLLLRALALAEGTELVYVRGTTVGGKRVVAAWSTPWLAIERTGPAGAWGRAWKLAAGQAPGMLDWEQMPKATRYWSAGKPRPEEVVELLSSVDLASTERVG